MILTGGEPTIAQGFDDLVYALAMERREVAVESNGTTWRESLALVDHLVVSPKDGIAHKRNVDPTLDPRVVQQAHEWRYVISGIDDPMPKLYEPAVHVPAHYVSPALEADGTGLEWQRGVPAFVPGAVERCLEIVNAEPRFRLSLQTHKWIKVR